MGLKAFHIVFILASSFVTIFFGAWAARNYFSPAGTTLDLVYAVSSVACLVALAVYGKYFLRKLKHISYL